MWIKQVELIDGGDGSTFITITMTNGAEIVINEDVPYDGKLIIPFDENGKKMPRVLEDIQY